MNVAIVKYNAGNIYSVVNALRRMGIEPTLTDDAELLKKADKVLFPGQGHAGKTMDYLRARRLDEVIKDLKQPVFGICVGQQLLCKHSEEGDTSCIGIFDAEVKRFQPQRHEEKVPCMGWNQLFDLKSPLYAGFDNGPPFTQVSTTAKTLTSISYIAIMCRYVRRPLRRRTISSPTRPRCTKTISTPASSIQRRVARWASKSLRIFWSYDRINTRNRYYQRSMRASD